MDSEWFQNPQENAEDFRVKQEKAEQEDCLQNAVTANTEYCSRSDVAITSDESTLAADPSIYD